MASPMPLGEVQAGLAAAQLGLVGGVIVDEGRRVEMFSMAAAAAGGALGVAAHGAGRPRSR